MKIKLTNEQIDHVVLKEMKSLIDYYACMDLKNSEDYYAIAISEAAAHILGHYGTPGKDFE